MPADYVSGYRDRDADHRKGVEVGESEDDPDESDRGSLLSMGVPMTAEANRIANDHTTNARTVSGYQDGRAMMVGFSTASLGTMPGLVTSPC